MVHDLKENPDQFAAVMNGAKRRRHHTKKQRAEAVERARKSVARRREEVRAYQRRWRELNIERKRAYDREYAKTHQKQSNLKKYRHRTRKLRTDPIFRMQIFLRARISRVLQGKTKSAASMKLIGCTPEFLRGYMEAQFQPGMNWENYGSWHVDHKKPCCGFDLTQPDQQRVCFHYSNLQPLWAKQNLSKGGKLIYDARFTDAA
jgi:hypothetical protein